MFTFWSRCECDLSSGRSADFKEHGSLLAMLLNFIVIARSLYLHFYEMDVCKMAGTFSSVNYCTLTYSLIVCQLF